MPPVVAAETDMKVACEARASALGNAPSRTSATETASTTRTIHTA